jgi:hypothetical protein
MAEPILDINTFVEHRTVRIDGVDYDLVNAGELSALDNHRLSKRAARAKELVEAEDEAQVLELGEHLDWLCRLVLRAPDEIHKRLTETHRLAIVQSFTDLQRESVTAAPATEEAAPPPTSTGESLSPA